MSRNALFVLLSLAVFAATAHAADRPIRQAQGRPNILFCISDDQSFPHAGAYGTEWVKTPGFDRVAREGLLFTRAYTPNAKCAPSRACILTGRNSWQLEAAGNHMPIFPHKFASYCEVLSKNGYFVGETGKTWSPGIAETVYRKPRQLAGKPYESRKAKPPARSISNNDYASNFIEFMEDKPAGKPWAFWYGATEPHRAYEYGAGVKKGGKKLSDIDKVPAFWPDNEVTRNDMLDYAFEIEHFDNHLVRILNTLEKSGELDNTLIVVTADNGMPFPRIKGQEYELSNHLPLAIMWKNGIRKPGRTIDDYVSFIDFAPTFIEVAELNWGKTGMHPSPGRSLTDIFKSDASGIVNPKRDHVLIGKERHDIGRPNDWGYPIRGIIKNDVLYLQNFEPTRWPAGNPETGYLNTDGSPTKTEILNKRRDGSNRTYWAQNFGKRPKEEMFRVKSDPDCVENLAKDESYAELKAGLRKQMLRELKQQNDPRILGDKDYFDNVPYAFDHGRHFYERYMSGENVKAGWVNKTDFEKEKLD
jgi:N-sulfoglucosamine sulfohydrolase